jgi:HAD superfamily hydrolase (TIGR01450 family)
VRLDDVRGFVFDADGTLVHRAGKLAHAVPGAAQVLEKIRASGRPFVVFTNGSHIPPAGFASDLRDAGLPVDDDQMLTPLRSALYHLERHHPDAAVRLFGTEFAADYLRGNGVRLIDGDSAERADVVFVAHVDNVTIEDLERAVRAVRAGAKLLTGSYVAGYSGANGLIISRGAMVAAAIAKGSEKRPAIVGKPSKAAVAVVSERLGVPTSEVAVIGDDLSMDIRLGHMGGSRTVLVRSGVSGGTDISRVPEGRRPDAVISSVAELLEML